MLSVLHVAAVGRDFVRDTEPQRPFGGREGAGVLRLERRVLACEDEVAAGEATSIHLFAFRLPTTFGTTRSSVNVGLRLSLTSLEGATASAPTPFSTTSAAVASTYRSIGAILVTCPASSQKLALVLVRSGERDGEIK